MAKFKIMKKQCYTCEEYKDYDMFWKQSKSNDGLSPYCISCNKELNKKQYKKRADKKVFPVIYNLEGEKWEPVIMDGVKYEYEISNRGRLKFFSRSVPRLLSTSKKSNVYSCHTLYGYGKVPDINTSIHRLVCLHFIPNPENLPEVNHKNCKKNDNHVDNLEWVTKKENSHHAFINGLRVFKYGSDNHISKLVLNTETGIFFDTGKEACEAYGLKYGTFIHRMSGRLKNNTSLIYA